MSGRAKRSEAGSIFHNFQEGFSLAKDPAIHVPAASLLKEHRAGWAEMPRTEFG
jgi:hypothetical protein